MDTLLARSYQKLMLKLQINCEKETNCDKHQCQKLEALYIGGTMFLISFRAIFLIFLNKMIDLSVILIC